MGLVGGIIAAPCTGPMLVSALTFVATTRSVAVGGSLLFTYALGMGVLFFAIAAFAIALPKSGAWMEAVKSIFGVVMLVAALYFLRNVVPALMHYGRPTPRFLAINVVARARRPRARRRSAVVPRRRRQGRAQDHRRGDAGRRSVRRHRLGADAKAAGVDLRREGAAWRRRARRTSRRVLDFYADWCIPCKEMDVKTFDKVADELQRFQLVKVDCTNDDDPVVLESGQALRRADARRRIIVLDSDGKVVKKFDGVVSADELRPILQATH